MISSIWHFILTKPLLNALAFLISNIPGGDVGLAVIVLTLIVKLAIFPLTKKSIENQAQMMKIAPELEKIKKTGASKEEQARQTFDLYKKYKVNPFSGCLLGLIQIPIVLALYFTFYKGINFSSDLLYSFVQVPENMNMVFLGIVDVSKGGLALALLAGVSQYLQAHFMPKPISSTDGSTPSFQESLGKSMHMQMKYVFPFVVAFIAYGAKGAIALYWITSNLFAVGQQIYAKRKSQKAIAVNN